MRDGPGATPSQLHASEQQQYVPPAAQHLGPPGVSYGPAAYSQAPAQQFGQQSAPHGMPPPGMPPCGMPVFPPPGWGVAVDTGYNGPPTTIPPHMLRPVPVAPSQWHTQPPAAQPGFGPPLQQSSSGAEQQQQSVAPRPAAPGSRPESTDQHHKRLQHARAFFEKEMRERYDRRTPVEAFVRRVKRTMQRMQEHQYQCSDSDIASFIVCAIANKQLAIWAAGNPVLREPTSSAEVLEELSRVLRPRTDLQELACQKCLQQPAATAVGQYDSLVSNYELYMVPQPAGTDVRRMLRFFPARMQNRLPLLMSEELSTVCASERAEQLRSVLAQLCEELARPSSGAMWVDVLAAAAAVDDLLQAEELQQPSTPVQLVRPAAAAAAGPQQQQQQQQSGAGAPVLSAGLAFSVLPPNRAAITAGNSSSSSSAAGEPYAAPYRDAAAGEVIKITLAGMMTIKAGVYSNGSVKCNMLTSLDYGCNSSCISEVLLRQRQHQFFAPGSKAELVELETPVQLSMFAGEQQMRITHVVRGLQLLIGDGIYTAGRYLLLPLTASLCRPGVEAPRRPPGAAEFWYPQQRVPISYPVTVQEWRVASSRL
ncbi:hypothetical protein OEZ85_004826 [Tetradesmus obliquus]|uniref:Uncharacterized protein n=1 Tax=Tetradesmus obliquus TaxID=3088 RepID=A0ABY8UIB5_TETOB|nr:hypothetical protein OEZ85_004826 [Tetradesmus obliquus]